MKWLQLWRCYYCFRTLSIRRCFTSIHIEEYTIERRQTKQGPEEITREIPNISENARKFLDDDGLVIIGTEVKPGDILVGKVTPKGQTQLSPEDKLLQAILVRNQKC